MNENRLGPWLMIAGGLFLLFGDKLPLGWGSFANIAGSTVVLVSEKTTATVDQTIAIRNANQFVEANKLIGFRDVDKDDEWAKPILEAAKAKNIEPPLVAYVDPPEGKITKVRKVVAWKSSFEESLK